MTPHQLRTLQEIERLIDEGTTVDAISKLLDHLPIDPEEKSALWLRAWRRTHHPPGSSAAAGTYLG